MADEVETGIGVDPRRASNFNNVKNISEMVATSAGMFMNQMAQAAIRAENAANEAQNHDRILQRIATATVVRQYGEVDPQEAKALTELLSGDKIAEAIIAKLTSLAGGQEALRPSKPVETEG